MPHRRLPGLAQVAPRPLGHCYVVDTGAFIREQVVVRFCYQDPPWLEELRLLANPWHARRRWQVELGFKLLAVARGQSLKVRVTAG